jgi:hypothetical protein
VASPGEKPAIRLISIEAGSSDLQIVGSSKDKVFNEGGLRQRHAAHGWGCCAAGVMVVALNGPCQKLAVCGAPQRDFLQRGGEERAGALSPLATKRHAASHAGKGHFSPYTPARRSCVCLVRSGGERTLSRTSVLSSCRTWRQHARGRESPSRAPHEGAASRDGGFWTVPQFVENVEAWERP